MRISQRVRLQFCLVMLGSLSMTANAQDGLAEVTPAQLFSGELQRLEPHLGLSGHGCVRVSFDGEKKLNVEVQVWHKGKSVTEMSGSQSPVKAGEVSISVREAINSNGKMMYKAIVAAPGGTRAGWIDMPVGMRAMSSADFRHKRTIKDGTPVAIWALIGSQRGNLTSNSEETVEQAAQRADWALVLSIRLTNKQ